MSRHLSYRFWFCLITGFGLLIIAVGSQSFAPLALGLPFLWMVVLSIVEGWWPAAGVSGVRLSSGQVIEGDELEFLVEVSAAKPVPWVEVEVQLPGGLTPVGPTRFVQPLDGSQQFRIRIQAERWGVRSPEWATVLTQDRFGMTGRLQQVVLTNDVRVHPTTEHLSSLVSLRRTRMVSGDHRSRRRGGGTEIAEVRSYRQGDPVRSIHPRLSARRGLPFVIERHPEQASDIVLYIDSVQNIGAGLDTSLRWTVTAAMALAERHLRAMDRVGILDRGAGVRFFDPSMGRRAQHEIVDVLLNSSVLQARTHDMLTVPIDRLPTGATVFAISPLLSTVVSADLVTLRRRGHEVIVIRPSTVAVGSVSPLAQRIMRVNNEVRRQALMQAGVLVIPWDPTEPLEQTLAQADQVRRRAAVAMGTA